MVLVQFLAMPKGLAMPLTPAYGTFKH